MTIRPKCPVSVYNFSMHTTCLVSVYNTAASDSMKLPAADDVIPILKLCVLRNKNVVHIDHERSCLCILICWRCNTLQITQAIPEAKKQNARSLHVMHRQQ